MKPLTILPAVFLAVAANAATLRFQWDPMPPGQSWDTVRIYVWGNGIPRRMVAEVPASQTQASVEIEPGAYSFVARAYAFPWGESEDSNVVTTPMPAKPPSGFRLGMILAAIGPLAVAILAFLMRRKG